MFLCIFLYILTALLIGYELYRYGLTRFCKDDQQGNLYGFMGFSIFFFLCVVVISISIVFDLNDGEVFASTHRYGKQYIVTRLENPISYWNRIAFRLWACVLASIVGLKFAITSYHRLRKRL